MLCACFNFDLQFHNECQTLASARFYSCALAANVFHKKSALLALLLELFAEACSRNSWQRPAGVNTNPHDPPLSLSLSLSLCVSESVYFFQVFSLNTSTRAQNLKLQQVLFCCCAQQICMPFGFLLDAQRFPLIWAISKLCLAASVALPCPLSLSLFQCRSLCSL